MAIGFIFNNPGQTQEQYDASVERLNLEQKACQRDGYSMLLDQQKMAGEW